MMKLNIAHFHVRQSKVKSIINESDIDDVFEPICSQIISYIQTLLGKGLS